MQPNQIIQPTPLTMSPLVSTEPLVTVPAQPIQPLALEQAAAQPAVVAAPEPAFTALSGVPAPVVSAVPAQSFQPVTATKTHFSDRPLVAQSLEICFRFGFALVFLINSATSLLQPASFRKLIEANFLAHALGHTQIMLYIIAANDALIGVLILTGWKKKYVYAWSGMWLFIVTFVKFTSLL